MKKPYFIPHLFPSMCCQSPVTEDGFCTKCKIHVSVKGEQKGGRLNIREGVDMRLLDGMRLMMNSMEEIKFILKEMYGTGTKEEILAAMDQKGKAPSEDENAKSEQLYKNKE